MPGRTKAGDLDQANDPEALKNLLLVLEHARADAWLRQDPRALEPLLAPDFVEINYNGRMNRDELLARLFPRVTLHTFTIEGPALRIICETAAILSYECYEEFTLDGRKTKGTYSVSALYTRYGKQWKISQLQMTPFKGR